MPKVSVIIPIYGVERTIERCARSLFEQSLVDMEYVFVNDATKDASVEILRNVLNDYPERKPFTKIINHKENLGLPFARKTGLENASGDYIIHCDSDDWVDRTYYESLLDEAEEKDADMVVGDFMVDGAYSNRARVGALSNQVDRYLVELLFSKSPFSLVNKLFKSRVYNTPLKFPKDNMGEDMALTIQLVCKIKTMSVVHGVYYHYDTNSDSISRKISREAVIERTLQSCRNTEILDEVLGRREYDRRIKNGIVYTKFLQRKHIMPIINDPEAFRIWKTLFPEINMPVLLNPAVKIPLLERLKFFLTLIGVFPIIKQYTRKNIC